MSDDEISLAEIEAERSLARIFGAYKAYVASLPDRLWIHGKNGWVSSPR